MGKCDHIGVTWFTQVRMVRFIKYGKLTPRNGDTSISTDLEWIPQVIQKVSHQVFYLDYRSLLA